jgi:hypothetical protein
MTSGVADDFCAKYWTRKLGRNMLKGLDTHVDTESFDDLREPAQTRGFTNFADEKEETDTLEDVESLDSFLFSLELRREPPLLDVVAVEEYVAVDMHESFV